MTIRSPGLLALWALSLLVAGAIACAGAENEVSHVQHILGMSGIKRSAHGTVSVDTASFQFRAGSASFSLPISSITDVYTDQDSVKAVGGVLGVLAGFAPYESGRVVSLFRRPVELLSIEYTDPEGGFHGLILRFPKGRGEEAKQWLVARGAHAPPPQPKPERKSEKK